MHVMPWLIYLGTFVGHNDTLALGDGILQIRSPLSSFDTDQVTAVGHSFKETTHTLKFFFLPKSVLSKTQWNF